MNKKKLLIAVVALLLVAVILWIYWGQPVSLQSFFSEKQWYYDMTLLGIFEDNVSFAVDEEAAGKIYTHLSSAKLKRGLPFDSWNGNSLAVYTFYDDAQSAWLMILVIADGRVRVADFGTKKDYYFRGGEDLYNSILAITEELPVKETSEKTS